MSSTKYILGLFDDPDVMMHGIDKLQKNSISIYDVYTPMPIHGIDAKLGVKESRLGYAAFMFGCLGGTVIFSIIYRIWYVIYLLLRYSPFPGPCAKGDGPESNR